jgi:hypothetical protein
MTTIQVRCINTGQVIKAQQISNDAGSIQRENLAKKLVKQANFDLQETYIVEVDNKLKVIDKYQLIDLQLYTYSKSH